MIQEGSSTLDAPPARTGLFWDLQSVPLWEWVWVRKRWVLICTSKKLNYVLKYSNTDFKILTVLSMQWASVLDMKGVVENTVYSLRLTH